jgi:hypothetical protein
VHHTVRLSATTAGVGYFFVHFVEMFVSMMLGMAAFVVVGLAVTAQGSTALLDGSSIHFQVGMGAFMVGPMVLWMRIRGCGWRQVQR